MLARGRRSGYGSPGLTCDQILLLGFVPVPWVAEADLASFTPVSGSSVTDDFCDRDRDRDREETIASGGSGWAAGGSTSTC